MSAETKSDQDEPEDNVTKISSKTSSAQDTQATQATQDTQATQAAKASGDKRSRVAWSKAVWTEQDIVIATKLGCTRERVRQKRGALGKPQSKDWHRRRGSAKGLIAEMETEALTVEQIETKAKCTRSYALQCLKGPPAKKFKKEPYVPKSKYQWKQADWSKGYRQIAEDLGIPNPSIVAMYRYRHGAEVERALKEQRAQKTQAVQKVQAIVQSSQSVQ